LASDHYQRHLGWRYRYCEDGNRILSSLSLDFNRPAFKKALHSIFCFFVFCFAEPPKFRKDYRAIARANVMDRVQISCPFYQQSGDSAGLFFRWTKVGRQPLIQRIIIIF
jgi:hypothetical protein